MLCRQAGNTRILITLRVPGHAVQIDPQRVLVVEQITGTALYQQGDRRAVLDHVLQTLARVTRIQWYVSATGLEDRQQPDHHRQAALDTDRYPLIRPHAQIDQVMRQAVGLLVELAIAQLRTSGAQGNCLRRAYCLGFEQSVQGLLKIVMDRCGVEVDQRTLPLLSADYRQMLHRQIRLAFKGVKHGRQRLLHISTDTLRPYPGWHGNAQAQAVAQVVDVEAQRVVGVLLAGQNFQALPCIELRILARLASCVSIVEDCTEQR